MLDNFGQLFWFFWRERTVRAQRIRNVELLLGLLEAASARVYAFKSGFVGAVDLETKRLLTC